MVKSSVIFSCSNCGSQFPKWQGQCSECGKWNTLEEEIVAKGSAKKREALMTTSLQRLSKVSKKQIKRDSTGIGELDRVLGGGLVKGEVVFMAGEPGIGKSTLLTQLALGYPSTIYVCGEESPSQVRLRTERFTKKKKDADMQLLPEVDVDMVIATLENEDVRLVIIDSIQSLSTGDLSGTAGSVGQIKECTARLIKYGKHHDVPIILVGHVTKDGEIAGPKVLEHMVDCVLDLSGDRYHELRLLRAVKNRFGATDEVGVFRMQGGGMEEVDNPSELFLDEREENAPGSAIAVVMEGTRPVLVEVQALVTHSELPVPRRIAQGLDGRRLQILSGVLQQHGRLSLGNRDVFVKVTGGLTLKEPAVDLAVTMAIASAHTGVALPSNTVCVGEVGLLGEIRSVTWYDKRAKEARKLGFKKIYSRDSYSRLSDIVKTLKK